MTNQIWRREEVKLKRLNTGWHDTFTETLTQQCLNGSQKCHVHKCLKIVQSKHLLLFFSFFFFYIQQHLCYIHQAFTPLSLVYCDMRYIRGKFLFMPQPFQHGNILFKILQHCFHYAMLYDCLKQQAIRS